MSGNAASASGDGKTDREEFRDHVHRGLSAPRKRISCKYLYDARGSQLFEEITELPEYYPTRTELALLKDAAPQLAGWIEPGAVLVEYGSGSSTKVRLVLDALPEPSAYVAVDISQQHLLAATRALARDYPQLAVTPVCADYTKPFLLPAADGEAPRLGFFPGSTIGNFSPAEALSFLKGVAGELGPGGAFLVGVDLQKDPGVLEAAYNDSRGVTAAFNLNLLTRINRELDGNFRPEDFAHHAPYNVRLGRIEMHLVSRKHQEVKVAGETFRFAEGETIHTENSYKYNLAVFRRMAERAGFVSVRHWCDRARLFSLHLLLVGEAPKARMPVGLVRRDERPSPEAGD